jgi:hypothetical protein
LNAEGIPHSYRGIKDSEGMKAYGKAAMPAMGQGGCTILSVDRAPHVLEGD